MSFYTKSSREVLAELNSKAEGLTSQEVSARQEKYAQGFTGISLALSFFC